MSNTSPSNHIADKESISIEGTLLMLDNKTPHVAISVQAIRDGEVIDTTLSDEEGKYRFVNLEPGSYQVRCQVLGRYVYYGEEGKRESQKVGRQVDETAHGHPVSLQVVRGKILTGIDFRFPPFKKGVWESYNTLDGLVFNVISDIYRAPDGVMWFAAFGGGISKYDGRKFTNLTVSDGLPSDYVWRIHVGQDGVMWFATLYGISRYDGKEFTNFSAEDGLVNYGDTRGDIASESVIVSVWAICSDPDGALWFGTSGGVSRYDGEQFINLTAEDGLPPHAVRTIQRDRDGNMWFGTWGGGVSRYDGERFDTFLPGDTIQDIYVDPDGVSWFATFENGVYRYDGERFINLTKEDGLASNTIEIIQRDPDGIMWFGTTSGVSRYDGKCFVNFTTADGLGHRIVRAIYRDTDGLMWFGTGHYDNYRYGGVSRYDDRAFVNLTTRDGLVNDIVKCIYRDPDGMMWFGTIGGISRYDGEDFANFTIEDGLANNTVNAIYRDPDGVMWFATGIYQLGGVTQYDGEEFVSLTTEDGLRQNCVNAIYRDPDGVMWFGTGYFVGGGVSRYDGEKFQNFTEEDGLAQDCVNAIHCDPDGVMWLGTNGGVSRYDGEEFANFTTEDGLADHRVNAICHDLDSLLWFGTCNGVSRYNGEEFVNFGVKDGLAHHKVVSIYCDADGRMWFGTDGGGVSLYDGSAWTSLDARDGLAGNSVISIHQDPDGALWFGTEKGITVYHRSAATPSVHIVSVTTDQTYRLRTQDARPGTERSIIPAFTVGTRVTVEYDSIDFKTVPEKRQYRCRVYETGDMRRETSDVRQKESVSSLKSEVSSLRSQVSEYNPPTRETTFDWISEKPGTYIFEVQAIDRDLNYSEPATLSLTVQPDPVLVSMQAELNHLRSEAGEKYHFENIIGSSVAMRQVHALMERAIDSGLTVLVIGETGTGKELVARAIHYNSPRKDQPLLARNCGAIPKDLLASDLFGHCKGAFTGANEDKMGLFEAASGGTVLLDEISEMPEGAQIHLLRVLQEREVQRLGEHISRAVDVRIIAMTNRDLVKEVTDGRFREDLYYRLSGFPIHIAPLRERVEDIPLLAERFLQDYLQEHERELGSFAPDVLDILKGYPWPGNVRELQNAVRRAAALAEEGGSIYTYHFPSQITQGESLIQEILSKRVGLSESVERFQRRLVEDALRECEGNRSQAARMLKMHRANFVRLMRRFGIE